MKLFSKQATTHEPARPVDSGDVSLLEKTDWSRVPDELPPDGQPVSQDPHWAPGEAK